MSLDELLTDFERAVRRVERNYFHMQPDHDKLAEARAAIANCFSEASILELQARTAETLDAERYRYLRNAAGQYLGDEDGPTVCSGLGDVFEYHCGPEVDEVVDEAIARWKAAGCPLPKEGTR